MGLWDIPSTHKPARLTKKYALLPCVPPLLQETRNSFLIASNFWQVIYNRLMGEVNHAVLGTGFTKI